MLRHAPALDPVRPHQFPMQMDHPDASFNAMQAAPYDTLETRSPQARAADFWSTLPRIVAHAKTHAPAWGKRLHHIDPDNLNSPEALAQLPVLRKAQLLQSQRDHLAQGGDVFGGHATVGWGMERPTGAAAALRVFCSPGPLFEPQGAAPDYWRMARALHAAGLRRGDLLHNSFSYHFTPAAAMLEAGALALGCTVFPAGIGQTEQQVLALHAMRTDAYCGTPSFLGILIDKAAAMGMALPQLRRALVSGEAVTPDLRARFAKAGIDVRQCYATADVGLIAYETDAQDGLVLDEHVWVDIVDADDRAVADGEVGEVVVTVLNSAYPLLRFGTGDLSAIVPASRTQADPCGRTQLRLRGWLGRADQATKVRGLFVHPHQVQDIVKRHAQILRARLQVSQHAGEDQMTLQCECEQPSHALEQAIQSSARECTKLRAQVQWLKPATLPDDGKLIIDQRPSISG